MRYFDIETESPRAAKIRQNLERNLVGQQEAINDFINIIEKFHSNIYDDTRPIANLLFVGPTGVGKTRLCELVCETLFDNRKALHKVDCAEFATSHEIAKLIGSPPGYLGHAATPARFKQETLNQYQTKDYPLSIVLFDEIEKAAPALWNLLLGILDKGELTLGNNTTTDFTKSIVILTSNVGAVDMQTALEGGYGFKKPNVEINQEDIKNIGNAAAKRLFTPEFINRLDKTITFNSLNKKQIGQILDIELERLQIKIADKASSMLMFNLTNKAKQAIIEEGYDPRYNGRNIKRVIEEKIKLPLAKIIATNQNLPAEKVLIDIEKKQFVFCREANV